MYEETKLEQKIEHLYNICSTQSNTEVKKWLPITSTNTTEIMQLSTLQTYLKITLWVQLPILK